MGHVPREHQRVAWRSAWSPASGSSTGSSDTARTTAGTGALGAYTTFSTFSWEAVRLIEQGDVAASARYVAATLVVGLVAAATGLALTGAL